MPSPTPSNDAAERKDRQLAYAQEVQGLTMRLIRATAARAEEALQEPDPDPEPERHAPSRPPSRPPSRAPDHVLSFVRLTRALNQTMAAENRIANDELGRNPPSRYSPRVSTPAGPPDPRRDPVQEALYRAVKSYPDRAHRRREIDQALDHYIGSDPDRTLEMWQILEAVSLDLEIQLDMRQLSDELIGMPPRQYPPNPNAPNPNAPNPDAPYRGSG